MEKCAATALNSKLIAGQKDFFSKMVVDAVMMLDDLLPLKMIGVKKVQGGALEVRGSRVLDSKEFCKNVLHFCSHCKQIFWTDCHCLFSFVEICMFRQCTSSLWVIIVIM